MLQQMVGEADRGIARNEGRSHPPGAACRSCVCTGAGCGMGQRWPKELWVRRGPKSQPPAAPSTVSQGCSCSALLSFPKRWPVQEPCGGWMPPVLELCLLPFPGLTATTAPWLCHLQPCPCQGHQHPPGRALQQQLSEHCAAAASVLCMVKQRHCSPLPLILHGLHVSGLGEQLPLTAVWQQVLLCCFLTTGALHLVPSHRTLNSTSPIQPLCIQPQCCTRTASPGSYSMHIPSTVHKGTLAPRPPHQYLWQARTLHSSAGAGMELGAVHPAPRGQRTKAPMQPISSPHRSLPQQLPLGGAATP